MSITRAPLFPLAVLLAGATLLAPARTGADPERINVEELGRLPAFSHATVAGELVFVAGTLGTLPGSFELAPGGVGPQTTQTLRNIETILAAAGSALEELLRCTVYLLDMDDFDAMNQAWVPVFGDAPPARAAVAVKELALGARVEIECIARRAEL